MRSILSLFITVLLACHAAALPVPPLKSRVNDYGDVLSAEDETALSAKLEAYEKETTDQIVILTIPNLNGDDIARFGQDVGDTWKIGQKGKDNGVIVIQSVLDRKIRIQTGRGLEGALPDARCKRIISEMVPLFKQKNFKGGYDKAVDLIIANIKQGEVQIAPVVAGGGINPVVAVILVILAIAIIVSIFVAVVVSRRSSGDDSTGLAPSGGYTPSGSYSPQTFSSYSPSSYSGYSSRSSSRSSCDSGSSHSSYDSGSSSSSFDFSGGGGGFDGGGASGDY